MKIDLYKKIEKDIEIGNDINNDNESQYYKQQVLNEFKAKNRQQFLERKFFKGKKCLPIGIKPVMIVHGMIKGKK